MKLRRSMFKAFLMIGISSLTIPAHEDAEAFDFQNLSRNEQINIKQTQKTLYSLGTAKNKNDIKVFEHVEDKRKLDKKDQYIIHTKSGKLKKGKTYKLIYIGDYLKSIKEIKYNK